MGGVRTLDTQSWLEAVFDASDDAIIGKSLNGTVLSWNRGATGIYGYTADEMIGHSIDVLEPPGRRGEIAAILPRIARGERLRHFVTKRQRRDGTIITVSLTISPVFDATGEITGASAVARDVTELTRAHQESEAALRQIARRYEVLLEHSSDLIFVVSADGRVDYINPASERVLGYHADGEVGTSIFGHVIPADQPRLADELAEILERPGKRVNDKFSVQLADGRIAVMEASAINALDDDSVRGIVVNAHDVTEREHYLERLVATLDAVTDAVGRAAELRDPYTAGHQRRVAKLAAAIARDLGLDKDTVKGIEVAAAIHDVGKLAIPAEILSNPGALRPAEFDLLKQHSVEGAEIVAQIPFPWPVAAMIEQHHERLDGSGYPKGLAGDEILLGSRIIAVADVVEAMSSHRPYRPALGLDRALVEVERGRGTLFDPAVVDACLRIFSSGAFHLSG